MLHNKNINKISELKQVLFIAGKESDPVHNWPDQIDHLNPEFNFCYFFMNVKCYPPINDSQDDIFFNYFKVNRN